MQLQHLHLVEICEEVFLQVLFGAISAKIQSSCVGILDEPRLELITVWLEKVVESWLEVIVGSHASRSNVESWKSRLQFFALETLATVRIGELFDIIVEYPQSQPALDDLKECLQRTKQYAEVVESLRSSFQKRLLHPGAHTSQILRVYIVSIKVIRHLDPSSVLLGHACPDLRAYLRQRSDTLRCIVSALTAAVSADPADEEEATGDGGDAILIEELQNNDQEIQLTNPEDAANEIAEDSDDDDGEIDGEPAYLRWTPTPSNTQASLMDSLGTESHRPVDILSLLLGIYGSKDVFVKEYTTMLAEKLFAITDFNTDTQLRNVELLKLKFGESSLQNCEIMLKDMADSKRATAWVNTKLQERESEFPLTATIVSYQFWPEKFKSAPVVPTGSAAPAGPEAVAATASVPAVVRDRLALFSEEYAKFKASRRLEWQDHLGQVELELEFAHGESREFFCTPQQASVIVLFDGGNRLSVEMIRTLLKIPEGPGADAAIRKRLAFWIGQGIVRTVDSANDEEFFECITSLREIATGDGGAHVGDGHHDGMGDGDVDVDDGNGGDDAGAEPYIMGMLTNLGSLPAERIHAMLSVLVPDYGATLQQTAALLRKMATAERIEQTGNEFSIKK